MDFCGQNSFVPTETRQADLYSKVPDSNLGHAMTILSVSARMLKQNVETDVDHFLPFLPYVTVHKCRVPHNFNDKP
jgi:hypothetical protein